MSTGATSTRGLAGCLCLWRLPVGQGLGAPPRRQGRDLAGRAGRLGAPARLVRRGPRRASSTWSSTSGRTRSIGSCPTPRRGPGPRSRGRLSETGLFASTKDHAPAPGVVPYAINSELWSDGAPGRSADGGPGRGAGRGRRAGPLAAARRVGPGADRHARPGRGRPEVAATGRDAGPPPRGRHLAALYLSLGRRPGRRHARRGRRGGPDVLRPRSRRAGGSGAAYRVAARSECVLCHNPWVETGNASMAGNRPRRSA